MIATYLVCMTDSHILNQKQKKNNGNKLGSWEINERIKWEIYETILTLICHSPVSDLLQVVKKMYPNSTEKVHLQNWQR